MSQELEEQTFIETTGSPNMINLKCRLWLDNDSFLDLTALLDTRATKSVMSYGLVPIKYYKELQYKLLTRTSEQRFLQIKYYIEPIGIQFLDFTVNYSIKYDIPQININPKHIQSKDFIIGLNFLFSLNGGIYLIKNYITLSKHSYSFPTLRYTNTSEFARKRGGQGNLDFF